MANSDIQLIYLFLYFFLSRHHSECSRVAARNTETKKVKLANKFVSCRNVQTIMSECESIVSSCWSWRGHFNSSINYRRHLSLACCAVKTRSSPIWHRVRSIECFMSRGSAVVRQSHKSEYKLHFTSPSFTLCSISCGCDFIGTSSVETMLCSPSGSDMRKTDTITASKFAWKCISWNFTLRFNYHTSFAHKKIPFVVKTFPSPLKSCIIPNIKSQFRHFVTIFIWI